MKYKISSFPPDVAFFLHLVVALQLEDALDDLHLGGSGLESAEGDPVVDHEPGPDDVGAAVDGAGAERHLEEVAEFVELFNSGLGLDESAVVAEDTVGADEQVVGDGVAEDLDAEGVGDDLLGLLVEVGVDEGHVVVAGDAVAEGRELLLDADHLHGFGEGVADVPEFVVGSVVGDEEALLVAGSGAADDAGAADGGLDDRNEGAQF